MFSVDSLTSHTELAGYVAPGPALAQCCFDLLLLQCFRQAAKLSDRPKSLSDVGEVSCLFEHVSHGCNIC